jgi:hypothetical protein
LRTIWSVLVMISGLVAAAPPALAICSPATCKPIDSCHTAACVAGVCQQMSIPGCADAGTETQPDAAPGTPDAAPGAPDAHAAPDATGDALEPRRDLTGCTCRAGGERVSSRAALELLVVVLLLLGRRLASRTARR